jgi:hypothetical protein
VTDTAVVLSESTSSGFLQKQVLVHMAARGRQPYYDITSVH